MIYRRPPTSNCLQSRLAIDIDQLLNDVAPGQTRRSLLIYLDNLKNKKIDGKTKYSDKTLFECASKKLMEQNGQHPCFNKNHKKEQKRLEWCENIIAVYEEKF